MTKDETFPGGIADCAETSLHSSPKTGKNNVVAGTAKMSPNFAKLLEPYAGEIMVLEWSCGLRLRVKIDTFEEGEDNEDGLDSICMDVLEVLRESPPNVIAGSLLLIRENEPLVHVTTASGQIIWSDSRRPERDAVQRPPRPVSHYVWSFVLSMGFLFFASMMSEILPAIGFLIAPGLVIAALVFPGGVHSDFGLAYLFLAMLIDVLLYAWVILWIWRVAARNRDRAKANLPR